MKSFTVWIKDPNVTLYVGGDIKEGEAPIITAVLENPQVLVDPDKKVITIVESK